MNIMDAVKKDMKRWKGIGKKKEVKKRETKVVGKDEKSRLYADQRGRCAGPVGREFSWNCPLKGRAIPIEEMQRDHIKPKKSRGTDKIENKQLLCPACNLRKSGRTMVEWLESLRRGRE